MTNLLAGMTRFALAASLLAATTSVANWSWVGERVGPIRWSASTTTPDGVLLMGAPGWALSTKDGDQFSLSSIPLDFTVHSASASQETGLVLAVGENGAIGRSEDAGKTWFQVRPRIRNAGHLRAVVWRDSVQRWMVLGDSGLTMESADGRTWSPGPQIPDARSVRRAVTLDGKLWILHDRWVVHLPAVRFLSPRGRTWEEFFSDEGNPIDLLRRPDGLVLFRGQDSMTARISRGDAIWTFSFDHYKGGSNRGWRIEGTRTFTAAFALDGSMHGWNDGGRAAHLGTVGQWIEAADDSLLTISQGEDFVVTAGNTGRLHSALTPTQGGVPLWDRRDALPSARTFTLERHGDELIASGGRGLASLADPTDLTRSTRDAFPAGTVNATWTGRAWIAPIDSGLVLVSRDGNQWRRAETGTTLQLRDFAFGLGISVVALDDGRMLVSEDDSVFTTTRSAPRTERFQALAFTGTQFTGSYADGTWCSSQNLSDWKCVGPNPSVVPQDILRAGDILVGRSRTFELLVSRNHGFMWTVENVPGPPIRDIAVDGDSLWLLHDDRTTRFRRSGDTLWTPGPTLPWDKNFQITRFQVFGGRILAAISIAKAESRRHALLAWTPPRSARTTRPALQHSIAPRWSLAGEHLSIEPPQRLDDWTLELRTLDGRILSAVGGSETPSAARLQVAVPRAVFVANLRSRQGSWSKIFAAP